MHLDPTVRLKVDFRAATPDVVINFLSDAAHIPIVQDPTLKGVITLNSAGYVSLDDAFSLLDIALRMQGYELAAQGKFLLVQKTPPPPPPPAPSPPPMMAHGPGGPMMPGMPGQPGAGAPGGEPDFEFKIYPIKYANATLLAKAVNDAYNDPTPAPQPGFMPQPQQGPQSPRRVRAVAEEYSNSLVVHAPAKEQAEIAAFVAEVDKQADQPRSSRVFKLKHARADKLEPVIESIVDNSSPLGTGSRTNPEQNAPANPFIFLFGGQQKSNNNGDVVSDVPTNSLTVTAANEVLDHVADVIKELDVPANYESNTFVYTFKNARADVVANLLNISFGNKLNSGSVGGSLSSQISNNSSSNNQSDNSQPPSLNGPTINPQNSPSTGGGGVLSITRGQPPADEDIETGIDENGNVVNISDLTGSVLLVPNIDTNSVIVVAAPQDRPLIEDILKQMDVTPEQVMIETLVVEATLNRDNQLGVEWTFPTSNLFGESNTTGSGSVSYGLQTNPTQPGGLFYTLTSSQFGAFVQALHTDSHMKVVSSPRVFTTNNALAQVKIGQSLPYITNQTVSATGSTLSSYNFLDVGLVLTIVPRIMSNGCVTMDVTQTANDFVGYTSFNAPIVNERETQTTINVKGGETAVLGGIIENTTTLTDDKVPVLGDLPLIGNLFRSTTAQKDKTELLIFLTPHVIADPADVHTLRDQSEADLDPKTAVEVKKALKQTVSP